VLLERARVEQVSQVELLEALEGLPRRAGGPPRQHRQRLGPDQRRLRQHLHLSASSPRCAAREEDRRPGDVLREAEVLAQQGVLEVTPPGQNVNSYGRSFGDRAAFGKLLRADGAVPGIERVRFTSPHPAGLHSDVVTAMAATPTVCPSLHMPLQSGSDDVLRAMRRSYRSERFLAILSRVRDQIPDAAITTDIIVGFPTETEADFAETLRVVEASRFSGAFTFQYSPHPGTPAAGLPPRPREVVQERYERVHRSSASGARSGPAPSCSSLAPRTDPTAAHEPPRASPASAHGSLLLLALVKSAVSGAGMVRRRWSVSTSFVRWGAPR
jgi:tRNA-2-methylthio-N6-dimethylallyladenosine synthase